MCGFCVISGAPLPGSAALAAQDEWSSGRPDGHAPIGVMGDHMHSKGEVMLSYRFMYMSMEGNRDGTDQLTPEEVLQDFPVTPVSMPMKMHMVGFMYAPADQVTLMGMLPIISMEMDHVTGMGGAFTTEASGTGDIGASAMIKIFNHDRNAMHFTAGISLPTRSIDEADTTPASMGTEVRGRHSTGRTAGDQL